MTGRFKLLPATHLFLLNDNQEVLLLRRLNTGYEDGNYSVIGGHLDGNEEVKEAAIREAREEAGIEVSPSDIAVVGVMHIKAEDEWVSFFLAASEWSGDIVNAEPDKCDDLSWHSIHQLPANMVPYVRQALKNYLKGKYFDSLGWAQQE